MFEHSRNSLVIATKRSKDLLEIDLDKESTRQIIAENQSEGSEGKSGID